MRTLTEAASAARMGLQPSSSSGRTISKRLCGQVLASGCNLIRILLGTVDFFIQRMKDGFTLDDVAEWNPGGDVAQKFGDGDPIPEFVDFEAYPDFLFVEAENVEEASGLLTVKPGLHWASCIPFKDGYPPPEEQLVFYWAEGGFSVEEAS